MENNSNTLSATKWKITLRQFFISSTSSMFSIMGGMAMGAPTVIIPQLRRESNGTFFISDEMVSWTSSASNFAAVPWSLFLIATSFYWGRKKTMFFINISTFLAFMNLYFSSDLTRIIVSQLILGMTDASMATVSVMLVTEYSSPKFRGIFLTYKEASYFWGIWISNLLGTYLHWTSIGFYGMIGAIYNFITILIVPESPYWLASKEKYDECTESYHWARGINDDTEMELNVLIARKKASRDRNKLKTPLCTYLYDHLKSILQPEMYRPMACCFIIAFLYIISGKQACAVYAIDIIKKMTSSEDTAYTAMLILDGCTVFAMYMASALTKVMKRKTLLILATIVCIFFMFVLSIYLYLVKLLIISENNFVSIFLFIGYSVGACSGPLMMCVVIFSELLPIKHRSVGIITCSVCGKAILAVFLKLTPTIFQSCGQPGTFLLLGLGCSLFLFLIYKYVPETKGKTLHEIAEYFRPNKCNDLLEVKKDDNVVCKDEMLEKTTV